MLEQWLPSFVDAAFLRNVAASLVFLSILMLVRTLVRRSIINRSDLRLEVRQRWLANLRNAIAVVFILGMALLWASEIETLAVSLVAIAAAIVLATREMILCLMGSLYRTTTQAYAVGDRIEVNGFKGQVIDSDMFSTTLIESVQPALGKSSAGRVVTFPNSLLLTHPVSNETMFGAYVLHNVTVSLNRGDDWQLAERVMLNSANLEIKSYAEELERHVRALQRGHGIERPTVEPRVVMSLENRESIVLHLQLPTPLMMRSQVEQRILRAVLDAQQQKRHAATP